MHTARKQSAFLLLLCIAGAIFLIYSNTFKVSWILDDQANILNNPPIHLQQFSWQAIKNAFYAYPESPGRLYRPVTCLSFAINWFVGQDNPFGYHAVNICIHILTTFFLYLASLKLVSLTVPPDAFNRQGQFIALFAALLWAMNPMQTQAVTYIVQRMAALAALFSVAGIFFFLKARTAVFFNKKICYSISCAINFLLALSSKENAILFPFSLILVETIFFYQERKILKNKSATWKMFFSGFAVCLLFAAISWNSLLSALNHGHRTFTLTEHALTSPRILLFYLSQLFFPLASRLSLEHDVIFSTSLFSPWTTSPAILGCVFLIIIGFIFRTRDKFTSFALLFYFLNHAVESTVIHLEPIFEHRNYLPSLFLFLPLASWSASLLDRKKNAAAKLAVIVSMIAAMVFLGVNTYKRNAVWSSAMTLWQDAHEKAPNSSRAAINLAKEHVKAGNIERALILSKKSYDMWQPTKNYAQAISLNAQGFIENIKGNYKKASDLFHQSLIFIPYYREARTNFILSLCKQQRFQEALMQFSPSYRNSHLEAVILLWLGRSEEALQKFRSVQEISDVDNMTGIGKALSMIGKHEQADFYLRQAAPLSVLSGLIQIENLIRANMIEEAVILCRSMLSFYQHRAILQMISKEDGIKIPLDIQMVAPMVFQQMKNSSKQQIE